ncbi:hypothetical protein D3C86_1332850 [compost metagenome]
MNPIHDKIIIFRPMKNFLTLVFIFISAIAFGQEKYWQQQVRYDIDVTLNDRV